MMARRSLRPLAALLLGAILGGGCGGANDVAGGGTSGTGISSGSISGFGSIIVNGIHFDVGSAIVTKDGQPAAESDLAVGMVVRVRGNHDGTRGTAVSVDYDAELRGLVETDSVDPTAGTFSVYGQTIVVDGRTTFSGVAAALSELVPDQLVEVSGWRLADGRFRASLVEVEDGLAAGEQYKLKGYVSQLGASSFLLGSLTVDYSDASRLPEGGLRNGMLVEVRTTDPNAQSGVLIASEIDAEDDRLSGEAGAEAELEGYVTEAVGGSVFYVSGQPVRVEQNTVFEPVGTDLGAIVVDARVEIEGRLDSDGMLVADQISLRPDSRLEAEGPADGADPTARTVTIMGVTFQVEAATRFTDSSVDAVRDFGLGYIQSGDWLEVRGHEAGGSYVADYIERGDGEDKASVRGNVADKNGNEFKVLGVPIDATAVPDATGLANGDYVEVQGQYSDGRITAEAVEREN